MGVEQDGNDEWKKRRRETRGETIGERGEASGEGRSGFPGPGPSCASDKWSTRQPVVSVGGWRFGGGPRDDGAERRLTETKARKTR